MLFESVENKYQEKEKKNIFVNGNSICIAQRETSLTIAHLESMLYIRENNRQRNQLK